MDKTLNPTLVLQAAQRLQGVVNRTPVITSRTLNQLVGRELFLKCENFQRVGAFKFRGAYNAIAQLTEAQKEKGVITHSSGNHAQGVALAAHLLGVKAVIVMPEDAPPVKREATAGYGAKIVTCKAVEREAVSGELTAKHGYTMIHPYDNPHVIAGQGTAALELFEEVGPLDNLFLPVGGGGLISGSALAAQLKSPDCKIIGVEPAAGDDAGRSWRTGEIVTLEDVPTTLADGARTRFIGAQNLAIMRQFVSDMTIATDDQLLQTLSFVWARLKIVVEPTAVLSLAPLFTQSYTGDVGQRVGIVLTGGNLNVPACGFLHQPSPAKTKAKTSTTKTTPPPKSNGKPSILITEQIPLESVRQLEQVADVVIKTGLDDEALETELGKHQAWIVGSKQRVTEEMIGYGFNLRAIGCLSSQLANIDVSAARSMGISVVNAPTGTAVAIAEHTLSNLLQLAIAFSDGRLAGKTLGIIGFGRVGQQVAKRARAFDMRIMVNQPRLTPQLALDAGVESADLNDILQRADFVSLHVPFKPETETIIGMNELSQMKQTACLLNTGHTDLVDDKALSDMLDKQLLAGAALSILPEHVKPNPHSVRVRMSSRVLVSPHVTSIIGNRRRDISLSVADQIAKLLQRRRTNEALALELVPIDLVLPHEQIDEKRVARLMARLEDDGRLVNPPLTTRWHGKYVVLDGATRSTAFKRLGYKNLIVQVVEPNRGEFDLHTWYHAISSVLSFDDLQAHLSKLDNIDLSPLSLEDIPTVFEQTDALCYFLDKDGNATLARVKKGAERLTAMNDLVSCYTDWGEVERTLITDLSRLLAQFPTMTAVAIFPQFEPETVFEVATRGELLPAGLTRFVIPGRILRLNADLARLKKDESLPAKKAWFNEFLDEKLARSRLRYYQEPVILLDE